MAYYTGTQAASATIAQDFMTTFDTYLISGGFTFVETYTSGTNITNIYKSPAASNSLAMDWYLFVNRESVGAATVGFGVAEAYNSSTHLATKYAPYGVPTTANTTDYTVSDGGVLPSATTSNASIWKGGTGQGGNPFTGTGQISTSVTYTWYLNVTPDRVIFGKSTATGASNASTTYAGILDPLVDNWNIVIGTWCLTSNQQGSTTSNILGATTRDYGIPATVSTATGAAYVWHSTLYGNTASTTNNPWGMGFSVADNLYGNNTPRAFKCAIVSTRNQNMGISIGLLKDVISHYDSALATTLAGGDTLSLTNSTGTYNYVRADSYSLTSGSTIWIPKQ